MAEQCLDRGWPWAAVAAVCLALTLGACGDDGSGPEESDVGNGDVTPSPDVTSDLLADVAADVATDIATDMSPDAQPDGDSEPPADQVPDEAPTAPPQPPTNVLAIAGNERVVVRWDPSAGADTYHIYWSTGPGVTTSDDRLGDVTSPHSHTGLTNGTTYYYVVTAANALGESGPSEEVSATPQQLVDESSWPMTAANPARTSWTSVEVTDGLQLEWYRPIEAYIPQNVHVISANGLVYVATARGLYAFDAATGDTVWRFDTDLPLGNAPTVIDGVAYVGGYDRRLHALDALSGAPLWSFDGADAGYDTNPLVVEGIVIAGNRDGTLYAIGAHGTADAGQLVWSFPAGGPIHQSAAYRDGVVYFAANDNRAYAVNVEDGVPVWTSDILVGDGFQSYWPVIYQDKVIFAAARSYRPGMSPGTHNVFDADGDHYGHEGYIQVGSLWEVEHTDGSWPADMEQTPIGPEVPDQDWAHGYPVLDLASITEYLETDPTFHQYKHKPWRRALVVLDLTDGTEFTHDSDGDGHLEYMPAVWWHTGSGNSYPPVVGSDDLLYFSNAYSCCSDAKGRVMGWRLPTPSLASVVGVMGALAEPQALSLGGNVLYRNLCCDRVADWYDVTTPGRLGELWSYDLDQEAPGYDSMWIVLPGLPRLWQWYQGKLDFYEDQDIDELDYNSTNGIYADHGVQNPLVPYAGRLYTHRSNAVMAYGSSAGPGALPLLEIEPGTTAAVTTPPQETLRAMLEAEIQKMLDAGHLRPGYYVVSQHSWRALADHFHNPGDTLFTLAMAHPHVSTAVQAALETYLQQTFEDYFDTATFANIGWIDGAPREAMPLPQELADAIANPDPDDRYINPREFMPGFSWMYPPHNFYALYRYVQVVPEHTDRAYELALSLLEVPLPETATTEFFWERPYELNAWLSGYVGFLALQDLAGMSGQDAQIRADVSDELDRLLQLRADTFSKDTWFIENEALFPNNPDRTSNFQRKELDVARNFLFLTPELGDVMDALLIDRVQEAVSEYDYVAPYWFVSRYECFPGEGSRSLLENYAAVFQAKAWILKETREELFPYLDVPAYARGDLYYIQNLVAVLNAPTTP